MHVNEVKYFDAIPIDSYGPGFFRIEGKILKSGIVCSSVRRIFMERLQRFKYFRRIAI